MNVGRDCFLFNAREFGDKHKLLRLGRRNVSLTGDVVGRRIALDTIGNKPNVRIPKYLY